MSGPTTITIPQCSEDCVAGQITLSLPAALDASLDAMDDDTRTECTEFMQNALHALAAIVGSAVSLPDGWRQRMMGVICDDLNTLGFDAVRVSDIAQMVPFELTQMVGSLVNSGLDRPESDDIMSGDDFSGPDEGYGGNRS